MKVCSIFLIMAAILVGAVACKQGPVKRPPITVNGKVSDRPSWALTGKHSDYPAESWFFESHFIDYVHPPTKSAMYTWLAPKLHSAVREYYGEELPQELDRAIKRGMWVSRRLIPDSSTLYYSWSDGVSSASYIALEKRELQEYLSTKTLRVLPPLDLEDGDSLPALEVFSFRTRRVGAALERLSQWALSDGNFAGSDAIDKKTLIDEAEAAIKHLKKFRQDFIVEMTGGKKEFQLGVKPSQPIQLNLSYLGKPAQSLPLRSYLENLNAGGEVVADPDVQTNSQGNAQIRFRSGIRYTGKEALFLGFALAPDKRLPEIESGVEINPWRTRVTLPTATNVVVLMTLREKLGGRSEKGPLFQALEESIRGHLPLTEDVEAAKRANSYILEVAGIMALSRLKSRLGSDQVRAQGSVILRHFQGPAIISIKVEGYSDIRGGDIERAEREALENLWAVHGDQIRKKLKSAFPPIMR